MVVLVLIICLLDPPTLHHSSYVAYVSTFLTQWNLINSSKVFFFVYQGP